MPNKEDELTVENNTVNNSWSESGVKEFCTPIEVDAGFVLDPSSVILSAKQLATSCHRNVLVKIQVRGPNPAILRACFEVHYYIQPQGSSGAFSEVKDVRIGPI